MHSFFARVPQSLAAAALAAVATAAFIGGYTATFANNDTDTIHACVSKRSGAVRIVTSASDCDAKSETATQWNQQGPQGSPGPQGPQGATGPAGTVDSLNDLDGIACTSNGTAGTVALNIGAGGVVSLTCTLPPPPPPTCPPPTPTYPNATVSCDPTGSWTIACYPSYQDLNGVIEDGCEAYDADGDNYYSPAPASIQDCDDTNASINPGAAEVENGLDDDCDGAIDDGLVIQLTMTPLWQDFYGDSVHEFTVSSVGGLAATNLNIFLMGDNQRLYAIQSTTCTTVLASGSSCTVAVSYSGGMFEQGGALLTAQAGDPANVASSVTATLEGSY